MRAVLRGLGRLMRRVQSQATTTCDPLLPLNFARTGWTLRLRMSGGCLPYFTVQAFPGNVRQPEPIRKRARRTKNPTGASLLL
jgi:hypothetical protein